MGEKKFTNEVLPIMPSLMDTLLGAMPATVATQIVGVLRRIINTALDTVARTYAALGDET